MSRLLEVIGPCMKQISVTVFGIIYTFKKVRTGLCHMDNTVVFNTIRRIMHNPDSTITNPLKFATTSYLLTSGLCYGLA